MTLELAGQAFHIETDFDPEVGPSYQFIGDVPICPSCEGTLTGFTVSHEWNGKETLVCECGHEMELS